MEAGITISSFEVSSEVVVFYRKTNIVSYFFLYYCKNDTSATKYSNFISYVFNDFSNYLIYQGEHLNVWLSV